MHTLIIPPQIFKEMIAHCRGGYPKEACGILAGKGNMISRIYKMANIEDSTVSYMLDPQRQFEVMKEMRKNNMEMVAIFHSHSSSAAYPSAKDVSLAFYEGSAYIIVSLAEKEPVAKAFSIREGEVKEIKIIEPNNLSNYPKSTLSSLK
ncbi:M67 family metallopeptidase [Thermodesulfovibrionales bacterium]|nr:M67 family metallopeptidase [Thermodesulfovibrionales bacterium]